MLRSPSGVLAVELNGDQPARHRVILEADADNVTSRIGAGNDRYGPSLVVHTDLVALGDIRPADHLADTVQHDTSGTTGRAGFVLQDADWRVSDGRDCRDLAIRIQLDGAELIAAQIRSRLKRDLLARNLPCHVCDPP